MTLIKCTCGARLGWRERHATWCPLSFWDTPPSEADATHIATWLNERVASLGGPTPPREMVAGDIYPAPDSPEREAFETWACAAGHNLDRWTADDCRANSWPLDFTGRYANHLARVAWAAWQARADLQ